jgi:hypothetical protein
MTVIKVKTKVANETANIQKGEIGQVVGELFYGALLEVEFSNPSRKAAFIPDDLELYFVQIVIHKLKLSVEEIQKVKEIDIVKNIEQKILT